MHNATQTAILYLLNIAFTEKKFIR